MNQLIAISLLVHEGEIKPWYWILIFKKNWKYIKIVKKVRNILGKEFPIIATGGKTDEQIEETIDAGANAITFTPPTSGEIFAKVMADYRKTH